MYYSQFKQNCQILSFHFKTATTRTDERKAIECPYTKTMRGALITLRPITPIGRIKKLESSPDVQKRKIGKITVVYLDENDKPKTVTANLNKNEYDKAIKAHERGFHIEIVGEVSSGKRPFMPSCESFTVIE